MQKRLSFFLVALFSVCVAEGWTQEIGHVDAQRAVPVFTLSDEYIKEWLLLGPFSPDDLDMDFLADVGGEANVRPYDGMSVTAPDGKSYTWKRYKSESDFIYLQDAMKQFLFSLELAFQSELDDDNERLSGDLRQEFENNGVSLSQNATISIGEKGSQWWITDRGNGQEYLILREEGKINIYSEPKNAVAYVACNLLSPKAQRLEMMMERYDGVKVWLNGALVYSTPKRNRWDTERFGIPLKEGENLCLIKVRQYIAGTEVSWAFKTQIQDYDIYLRSLELKLNVRRQHPDGRDELTISARREPQSKVWELSSLPVQIEIRDEASHLLATLQAREGEPVVWKAPEDVQGVISILATQTDSLGRKLEDQFTCRAHNITPITPRVGHWETYDVTDGLGGPRVTSIVQDRNGILWFGLPGAGICRYDGRTFRTFTKEDGLPSNDVSTIFEDSAGVLWIGTYDAGVCKYDGKTFQTFTTKDGLADDDVMAIYEDDRGHLWFGTWGGGVSEFDGRTFQNYTKDNGLPSDMVGAITQDRDGNLWFGHGRKGLGYGYGATRYDGESFRNYTTKDGLADRGSVCSITADTQGNLWFGIAFGVVGVSRYDGKGFQNFTTEDGLADNSVYCIAEDREGNLYFGTSGGVSRYDESVLSIPVSIGGIS